MESTDSTQLTLTNDFALHLEAQGKSKNTIVGYTHTARQFLQHINQDTEAITQKTIDSYFARFNPRNQTQNYKKNAVSSFLKFLKVHTDLTQSFSITTKSVTRPEPAFLTNAEQKDFIEKLKYDTRYQREYAIFSLMLYAGLRIGEALALRVSDVSGDHIQIRESKTGKAKLPFKIKLKKIIDDYLAIRRKDFDGNIPIENFLFVSKRHSGKKTGNKEKSLDKSTVNCLLKFHLKRAGIVRTDISPHSLRHTFATRLHEAGKGIDIIGRLLRHKSLETTRIYQHINEKTLAEAVESI